MKNNEELSTDSIPYIISDQYDGRLKKLYQTHCELCDKEFFVPKGRLEKARFCSIACSTENQKRIRNEKKQANPIVKKEPKYRVGPRLPGNR